MRLRPLLAGLIIGLACASANGQLTFNIDPSPQICHEENGYTAIQYAVRILLINPLSKSINVTTGKFTYLDYFLFAKPTQTDKASAVQWSLSDDFLAAGEKPNTSSKKLRPGRSLELARTATVPIGGWNARTLKPGQYFLLPFLDLSIKGLSESESQKLIDTKSLPIYIPQIAQSIPDCKRVRHK